MTFLAPLSLVHSLDFTRTLSGFDSEDSDDVALAFLSRHPWSNSIADEAVLVRAKAFEYSHLDNTSAERLSQLKMKPPRSFGIGMTAFV